MVDVAIERGRAVELYPTDHTTEHKAQLRTRIDKTFHKAHENGMFNVSISISCPPCWCFTLFRCAYEPTLSPTDSRVS